MSRSLKDGRRRGGHRDVQCREFWSRRYPNINGCRMDAVGKRMTHRYERRIARVIVRRELMESAA